MKILLTYLLLTLSSITSIAQQGDSWAKVKASGEGVLTIVYYEQPGLIQKVDGKMKGVCVDILDDFTKFIKEKYNKNVKLNYDHEETEFANFLKVCQTTPNILGVTNTSITEARKRVLKFTPPFMSTQLVLLTNKNTPDIKSLAELPKVYAGYTAEVITGSTHVKHIEKIKQDYYPALKVEFTASSESVIKNLSSNSRMFSILDFTEYVGVVRRKLPIKRQDIELGSPEQLGFIMSKQSDWEGLWNEFLTAEYRKSVGYKKIIADNLGSTFLNLVR